MLINVYQVENVLLSVQVNIFEAKTAFSQLWIGFIIITSQYNRAEN